MNFFKGEVEPKIILNGIVYYITAQVTILKSNKQCIKVE